MSDKARTVINEVITCFIELVYILTSCQYVAGDYVELIWRSASGNSVVATYPEGTNPTRPTSPGLIVTVTQVA